MEPIRDTEKQKGSLFVVMDGADGQRRPIINFMAVTKNGLMFLNSVNVEREVKNMHYITEKFEDYIREVGAQMVI